MTVERAIRPAETGNIEGPPAPLNLNDPHLTRAALVDELVLARRTVLELSGIEGDDINLENELKKRVASQRYAEGIDLAQQRRFNIPKIITEVERRLTPEPELPTR